MGGVGYGRSEEWVMGGVGYERSGYGRSEEWEEWVMGLGQIQEIRGGGGNNNEKL